MSARRHAVEAGRPPGGGAGGGAAGCARITRPDQLTVPLADAAGARHTARPVAAQLAHRPSSRYTSSFKTMRAEQLLGQAWGKERSV